ncbi:unnamed protein product [Diamesa serratosioi]
MNGINRNDALKMFSTIILILLLNSTTQLLADEVPNAGNDNSNNNYSDNGLSEQGPGVSKRAWSQLQGGWGKRSVEGEDNPNPEQQIRNIQRVLSYLQNDGYNYKNNDYDALSKNYDDNEAIDKRAWKSMNGGWGKRQNDWGKREQKNWSNLNAMWGKRASPQSWNNLSSAWGKRAAQQSWNNLSSAWGKRK